MTLYKKRKLHLFGEKVHLFWLVALQVIEDELRERIERLETRQATDDASLLILNRYWNQVDKDSFGVVRLLAFLTIGESKCDAVLSLSPSV